MKSLDWLRVAPLLLVPCLVSPMDAAAQTAEPDSTTDEAEPDEEVEDDQPSDSFELQAAASKRRTLNEAAAPGVITTVQVADLVDDPLLTLADWLDVLPGFHHGPAYGVTWPAALGLTGSVKAMINGISITNPRDYSYTAGQELFLEEFDTIETTSGPAGVLWGQFSFLGVINMMTPSTTKEEIKVRIQQGMPSLHRASVRASQRLGKGNLRLFLGGGSWQTPDANARTSVTSLQPYAPGTVGYTDGAAPQSRVPANHAATASVQYDLPKWRFYLRVPTYEYHYGTNAFGVTLPEGQTNFRRMREVMGSTRYTDTFLNKKLVTLSRVTWRYTDDFEDTIAIPASSLVGAGGRRQLNLRSSQINGVTEARFRLQKSLLTAETLVGAEATAEITHGSYYAGLDRSLSTSSTQVLGAQQKSVERETLLFPSFYGMQDFRLFNRLTLTGGVRFSPGADVFADSELYEANAAFRVLEQTYVKVTSTQGYRPPQVLDRQGIIPVQQRFLQPETSTALQAEVNSRWEDVGPFKELYGRFDFASTQTENNIVKEPSQVNELLTRPVNADGFNINSLEALVKMHMKPRDMKVLLSYFSSSIEDVRASGTAADIQGAIQENPRCVNETCVNVGPAQAAHLRVSAIAFKDVYARLGLRAQCGGLRSVPASSDTSLLAPYENNRVPVEQPCLATTDIAFEMPLGQENLKLGVAVDNVLDQRLPPMIGSNSIIDFNEGFGSQLRGRTGYLSLRWNPQ